MDMDELFSQVDEKRKVSMAILYHSVISAGLFSDCPHSTVCGAAGGKFIESSNVLRVLADTLAHGSHHGSLIVDMATRE